MPIADTLPHPPIVDNPPRYTREQAKAGGRISGESRRFNSRPRHAEVRRLFAQGYIQAEIARQVHYHPSTVSRILRGIIRTCLTIAETASNAVAYPLESIRQRAPLRELSYTQKGKGKSPTFRRKKKAWNFFKGKWAGYFRRKFAEPQPEPEIDEQAWDAWHNWLAAHTTPGHPCCFCGETIPETGWIVDYGHPRDIP